MDNQTSLQNGPGAGGQAQGAFNMTPVGQAGSMQQPIAGMGPVPTTRLVPVAKQSDDRLPWMIGTIIAGLIAVVFVGLFIWILSRYNTVKTDVDGQITAAVTTAVNEKTDELETQFIEREKYPYNLFAGPADYGELSFEYPKTWSVYEAKDASNGGDYEAYLNPDKVYPVSSSNINAIRVLIKDQSYDSYIRQYENYVKNGKLSVSVRPINGENANLYTGELPNTDKLQGIAAVFKLRDKAAVIQTDAMIFESDFQKILDSVSFNR